MNEKQQYAVTVIVEGREGLIEYLEDETQAVQNYRGRDEGQRAASSAAKTND